MDLQDILQDAKKKIQECGDINSLLHEVKSSIFGKKNTILRHNAECSKQKLFIQPIIIGHNKINHTL